MNLLELAEELESLLPDLRHSRATHIQWRDCDQSWRDANPHIGSKEFHADAVADYDRRIAVIIKAVNELRAAITEQPLSDKWREVAYQIDKRLISKPGLLTSNERWEHERETGYRRCLMDCAADLDAYHDEGRALLERDMALFAETAIRLYHLGDKGLARTFEERSDRIRKHLEGQSDE